MAKEIIEKKNTKVIPQNLPVDPTVAISLGKELPQITEDVKEMVNTDFTGSDEVTKKILENGAALQQALMSEVEKCSTEEEKHYFVEKAIEVHQQDIEAQKIGCDHKEKIVEKILKWLSVVFVLLLGLMGLEDLIDRCPNRDDDNKKS